MCKNTNTYYFCMEDNRSIIPYVTPRIHDFLYGIGYFSSCIIISLTVIIFLYNHQYLDILGFLVTLYLNTILNRFLKILFKHERPMDEAKFLISDFYSQKNKAYGMPSGHSQTSIFSFTYLYFTTKNIHPWLLLSAIIVIILMIIQRLVFKNHTILQLLAGGIIGAVFAYIIVSIRNIIVNRFLENKIIVLHEDINVIIPE